jgi:hypothetical protein
MLTVVLNHLSLFPEVIQHAILIAWGLLLVGVPLVGLIKMLQTRPMEVFFKGAHTPLLRLSHHLVDLMADPIEYPRIKRALVYADVAVTYLMAAMLALIATIFTFLGAWAHGRLSVPGALGLLAYVFLCWCVATVLRAQAGRDRVKLRTTERI